MKKSIIKDALILCLITLVAGFLLGVVHDITLQPIAAANEAAQQDAYRAVFEDAEEFVELPGFDAEEATQAAVEAGYTDDTVDSCVQAVDADGNLLGYVINATDPSSYGGDVTLSLGRPSGWNRERIFHHSDQ